MNHVKNFLSFFLCNEVLPCFVSLLHLKFAFFSLFWVVGDLFCTVGYKTSQISKHVPNFFHFWCWFVLKFSNLLINCINNAALNPFNEELRVLKNFSVSDGLKLIITQIQNFGLKICKNGRRFVRCIDQLESHLHKPLKIISCCEMFIVGTFLNVEQINNLDFVDGIDLFLGLHFFLELFNLLIQKVFWNSKLLDRITSRCQFLFKRIILRRKLLIRITSRCQFLFKLFNFGFRQQELFRQSFNFLLVFFLLFRSKWLPN